MRFGTLAVLVAVAFAGPAPANADGQRSYRLPEVRETPPASSRVVRTAAWSLLLDQVEFAERHATLAAVRGGSVVLSSGGRMCAFDERTGARRWCAGAGSAPAYADGMVAFAAPHGIVRGVDARTGAERWHHPGNEVWPLGANFLLAHRLYNPNGPDHTQLAQIDRSGGVLWEKTVLDSPLDGPSPALPFALLPGWQESNDREAYAELVLRLGAGGGVTGRLPHADDVLSWSGPRALLIGKWRSSKDQLDDYFTAQLKRADVRRAAFVSQTIRLAPDFDDKVERMKFIDRHPNGFGGFFGDKRIKVEGDDVYFAVLERVYRYRLTGDAVPRPLMLSERALLVLGPHRGTVYVIESDGGVWALRSDERRIHARRVARTEWRPVTRASAIVGRVAYLAFADGRVLGVDVDDGRVVLEAKIPGEPFEVGSSAGHVFFACSKPDRGAWHVVAFARPDAP